MNTEQVDLRICLNPIPALTGNIVSLQLRKCELENFHVEFVVRDSCGVYLCDQAKGRGWWTLLLRRRLALNGTGSTSGFLLRRH